MKKNILFGILLIIVITGYTQEIKPRTFFTKQDYLRKSKQQKIVAWVLAGSGSALSIIGGLKFLEEAVKVRNSVIPLPGQPIPDEAKVNGAGILILIGGAAIISSVPLFVASGKNKKRAAVVTFKNIPIMVLQRSNLVNAYTPSVNVTIPF